MNRLKIAFLLCISLLTVLPVRLQAQASFPSSEGECIRYSAYIEMPKAYLSGICMLLREGDVVKGCLFNEFGMTALDFTYQPDKQKVKINHIAAMMDKWYIRRVLRRDLAQLMQNLQTGKSDYNNNRRHIQYRFIPHNDAKQKTYDTQE